MYAAILIYRQAPCSHLYCSGWFIA
ncbi:MAG: hypothetical protein JWM56_71, partial [Candidatus Peribacteria bacterium]|nr:hypothetical protein [Candidatus Peribacteria bacterium]